MARLAFSAIAFLVALACLATPSLLAGGQEAAARPRPTFEAASVKSHRGGERTRNTILPGGRYSATNVPLRMMIRSAYGIQDFQLVGGPAWLNTDGYDVVAKAATDEPPDRLFAMVRSLLEDRFRLVAHRETRTLPVYALVRVNPDRLGRQLRPSDADCAGPPAAPGRPRCGILMNFGELRGTGASLGQLATSLAPFSGRAIQDRTGASGAFDFELQFTPDPVAFPAPPGAQPPAASADGPSLFTAVQEQLGLKLESTTAPLEVLVIDRVERPTND
ncbi:MAG TPA: TIGR03435 family protein [Vicinamibacterales bacterium]|jgi:uncharacterized protein (TIGR03435 family)|nr:TIGR03435 family protein [Vicinamibacterales bacterium]